LEAIIALALLAGTGLALLSWIQQSLQTVTRLRYTEQQARLLLSSQALIESINPAEQAEGSLQLNGLSLSWKGVLVEPARRNITFAEGVNDGPWQVGLYRLAVSAKDNGSAVSISFVQFRTGLIRLSKSEWAP
jgi:hypothetical protein